MSDALSFVLAGEQRHAPHTGSTLHLSSVHPNYISDNAG
jgi:hypothetical protein